MKHKCICEIKPSSPCPLAPRRPPPWPSSARPRLPPPPSTSSRTCPASRRRRRRRWRRGGRRGTAWQQSGPGRSGTSVNVYILCKCWEFKCLGLICTDRVVPVCEAPHQRLPVRALGDDAGEDLPARRKKQEISNLLPI